MSDDVERPLEEFYRRLGPPARRVEAQWRSRAPVPAGAVRPVGVAWLAGAVAVSAVLAVLLFFPRRDLPPSSPPAAAPSPAPGALREPQARAPEGAAPARPLPPEALPALLAQSPPAPQDPVASEPSPPVDPEPGTPPEAPGAPRPLRPEDPLGTRAAGAAFVFREVDGALEVGRRPLRGKRRDLGVDPGETLRADSVVRLTLSADRWVLLAPRTTLEVRAQEDRLVLALEQGELLAELGGPGPSLAVQTKSCLVTPMGTVFSVSADERRTQVVVERGRVEVQGARGRASARAGEMLEAAPDGLIGSPQTTDLRSLGWARSHRAAESTVFFEDFGRPGGWQGAVEKGMAKALRTQDGPAVLHLAGDRPIFEVPVRGQVTMVYRADRASRMYLQFFAADVRLNYRREVSVLKSSAWKVLTLDLDEFRPSDRSRAPARLPPGSSVTDISIVYGEEGEKGSFWVSSLRIAEQRP